MYNNGTCYKYPKNLYSHYHLNKNGYVNIHNNNTLTILILNRTIEIANYQQSFCTKRFISKIPSYINKNQNIKKLKYN